MHIVKFPEKSKVLHPKRTKRKKEDQPLKTISNLKHLNLIPTMNSCRLNHRKDVKTRANSLSKCTASKARINSNGFSRNYTNRNNKIFKVSMKEESNNLPTNPNLIMNSIATSLIISSTRICTKSTAKKENSNKSA